MIIISTDDFVAGVFEHRADALRYLEQMPNDSTCMITELPLSYPFWLVEKASVASFLAYQTEAETERFRDDSVLIYTIFQDYQPPIPWTDHMGSLAHFHPSEI